MDVKDKKINFRYKCRINEINYDIQLFNLEQEKIKIMINTKNPYSDEYVEYSNVYTLIQFQEITNYYILFESVEEIFEDLARTIQEKNFAISHNGSTMTFKIKVLINKKEKDVQFILDKTKTIDLSSQRDSPYYNTLSTKYSEYNKFKNNYLEKSKRNINISDLNELNTLLSDFKDRIAVLEQSQNSQINKKEEYQTDKNMNNLMTGGNSNFFYNNNINQSLENILNRLNKLETDNKNKDLKIKKLEKKLKYYESMENQENQDIQDNQENFEKYDNNINSINNINDINKKKVIKRRKNDPKYEIPISKTMQNKNIGVGNFYANNNPLYSNRNNQSKRGMNLTPNRLKQTKTEFINSSRLKNNIFYNNENASLHSRETQKYNDKFSDQQTNSYLNNNEIKTNSSLSNYSNQNERNFQKYVLYKERLQIPIVPREDIKKFVNSRIIFTRNELKLLKTKFTKDNKKLHAFFDLLYRASIDGDYEDIVKTKLKHKEKILTLFYTYEGARFGVYVCGKDSTSFIKGKIFKEIPGTSFMVSLNNLKFFDILPDKTSKDGEPNYLCFGRTFYLNNNGSNWIINTPRNGFLKKKCIIGDKGGDYMNLDTELLVGVRNEYHLKDVEIFEVCIEKDEESSSDTSEIKEKKKKKKKK